MSSPLLDAVAPARVIFVVGKGGVGKTTAAAALALESADSDIPTHLISTDPAHSIGDLFAQPLHAPATSNCNDRLLLEEFDASAYGAQWLARALGPVGEIVEGGTYLDADDVAGFSRLALPGVDEMMAVLRLTDIARAGTHTLIIDTAPTGHTLRLLDAAATHEGIAHALRAMADKAAAVAGSLLKSTVRLRGERIIDELESYVSDFRTRVLDAAAFVIATRDGDVVAAETARLARSLADRKLRIAATVAIGSTPATHAGSCFVVPRISTTEPCALLRDWRAALRPCAQIQPAAKQPAAAAISGEAAIPWLRAHTPRLVFVAGKGGVGKSTCAAATALALAEDRNVLLCSTDPAGSLDDVFGADVTQSQTAAPQLRVLQIRADEALDKLRATFRSDVVDALAQLGIGDSAELDRRVIDALWSLTPPGLDELLAVIALLDTAEADETVVIDSAPTGHFLRLLQMPGTALDWTHQLMRVIVKYGIAGTAGGAAETLLRIARELRALEERLHDPAAAGVFVVTLPEQLVRAETERLTRTLGEQGMHVVATFENRSAGSTPGSGDAPVIQCPDWQPSPQGEAALREWSAAWKIVP